MKHIGAVLTSLIALGIVISLFSKAGSGFEKIVFSLLVMIYLRIAVFEGWNHLRYYESLNALGRDFWEFKKFLQEERKGFKEFKDEYEPKMVKTEGDLDKLRMRTYIETGIISIIFFIALYHLLRGLQIF